MQVEALNSTLCSVTRTIIDDHNLEDGKGVERTDQGSSTNYHRIRKQARANQEAPNARTPPAA